MKIVAKEINVLCSLFIINNNNTDVAAVRTSEVETTIVLLM
jgi:hypothetical protein